MQFTVSATNQPSSRAYRVGEEKSGSASHVSSRISELFSPHWIVISVHKNSWLVPGGNCTHHTSNDGDDSLFLSLTCNGCGSWYMREERRKKRRQTLASPSLPHSQFGPAFPSFAPVIPVATAAFLFFRCSCFFAFVHVGLLHPSLILVMIHFPRAETRKERIHWPDSQLQHTSTKVSLAQLQSAN